jgi:UDP-N-acetylglucosamine 2-epimerase
MNDKPILICFGTRPEFLKIKPILDRLERKEYILLFTGQHTDLLSTVYVDYSIQIGESTNRLDSIVSSCLTQFPEVDVSGVLVQGDTASAFACALAAFHRRIPIYYLEAGLRSNDLNHPYPEEGYRQLIARLSSVNFAPTELSKANLEKENVIGKTFVIGNTSLDNLLTYPTGHYGNQILVTLHRRENHDSIKEWFQKIEELAQSFTEYQFILPIHPNPNVQLHRSILQKVKVVEPLSHHDTINIIRNCRFIISDSGGIQEEGAFFNKKVIVCRKTTERPEGIGTGHLILCETPDKLESIFKSVDANPYIDVPCPYGDGMSSKRVQEILHNERV